MVKLSKFLLNPNNPQKFDDLSKLKNSIAEFPKMMELRPIVYDPKTMYVLGGNKRLICLNELGYNEVNDSWFVSAEGLSDDEKRRFVIADNIGFGEWDLEILEREFDDLNLFEFGLDLELLKEDIDFNEEASVEIPEEEEEVLTTNIKHGDVYKIGKHYLMCGDSTKESDKDMLIKGNIFDTVLTDPPYEIDFNLYLYEKYCDNANIFVFHNDRALVKYLSESSLKFIKFFIFNHEGCAIPQNGGHETFLTHILISHETKGDANKLNKGDGLRTVIKGEYRRSKIHKHEKPQELLIDILKAYTNKDSKILDLFGGSGSLMVSAQNLNIISFLMEFDPLNCQKIINRMELMFNLKAIKQ